MTEQMDLPPLFGKKGEYIGNQWPAELVESLPPERRKLFDDVGAASAELDQLETDLRAEQAIVLDGVKERDAIEAALKRSRPSFHDLWLATVKGKRT